MHPNEHAHKYTHTKAHTSYVITHGQACKHTAEILVQYGGIKYTHTKAHILCNMRTYRRDIGPVRGNEMKIALHDLLEQKRIVLLVEWRESTKPENE